MKQGNPIQGIIPFPVERRVDSHARAVVVALARAQLITEAETVRVLEELGAAARNRPRPHFGEGGPPCLTHTASPSSHGRLNEMYDSIRRIWTPLRPSREPISP